MIYAPEMKESVPDIDDDGEDIGGDDAHSEPSPCCSH